MKPPALSLVVPAYNEGASFGIVLGRLTAYLATIRDRFAVELIVVDDGSTDETPLAIGAFAARHPQLTSIRHVANRGLEGAVRTGVDAASFGCIAVLDADLSYAPEILDPLVGPVLDGRADISLASPYMPGGRVSNVPFVRLAASRGANLVMRACTGGRVATFTGMVRAYDAIFLRDVLRSESQGEFNAWIVVEALRRGARIAEIPAHLAWPESRRSSAPRLPLRKLWSRTVAVFEAADDAVGRGAAPRSPALGAPPRPIAIPGSDQK